MTEQERFETLIAWMRENVLLVSHVHIDSDRPAFDPSLHVRISTAGIGAGFSGHSGMNLSASPTSNVSMVFLAGTARPIPADQKKLASVTALVVCCYMDALGKVLRKGSGGNQSRFLAFGKKYLDRNALAGGRLRTLYRLYRTGFVHQFSPTGATWSSDPSLPYWTDPSSTTGPHLNVRRFAEDFLRGLLAFHSEVGRTVARRETSYGEVFEWLDARQVPQGMLSRLCAKIRG